MREYNVGVYMCQAIRPSAPLGVVMTTNRPLHCHRDEDDDEDVEDNYDDDQDDDEEENEIKNLRLTILCPAFNHFSTGIGW